MAPSRTGLLLPPPPREATTTPACTLPYDLVLEIVARSDVATVVRSAATCKPLRRDIHSAAFIRRVCHCQHGAAAVPPYLVGYLRVHSKAGDKSRVPFSLVHPATPAAASFTEDHLAPFLSRRWRRRDACVGRRYVPLTSRNGLVLLTRRGRSAGICVYDPMTGDRKHLPRPPGIMETYQQYGDCYTYVLLTAADGVGCSFLLLATDYSVSRVRTVSSDDRDGGGTWGPVISVAEHDRHRGSHCQRYFHVQPAVVLNGLIHWLMCKGYSSTDFYILTYDVPRHGTPAATTAGSIEVPKVCLPDDHREESDLHLTTSPDGRLSLLVADRFTISIWLLSGSTDWARQSVIDSEPIVRSRELSRPSKVDFVRSLAGMRSGVVLLRSFMNWDFRNDKREKGLLLLDVGTEEMRRVNKEEGFPYEVDLEARLSAMKIFD